jgi:GNAT superfamily N-acetyltransferase
MSDAALRFERLSEAHSAARAGFTCGVEELDRYIRSQASQDVRRGLAVTWVLFDYAAGRIAGYYTLSAATVELSQIPEEIAKRVCRYPTVPAILIGRLATDTAYRGKGLGASLLVDALRRSSSISRTEVGAAAVVVDAIDSRAEAFYEHFGFQALHPVRRRLFLAMRAADSIARESAPG